MNTETDTKVGFQVGDVVYLKSGGAPMTVLRSADHNGEVMCGWHDYEGRPVGSVWPAPCLTATKPD